MAERTVTPFPCDEGAGNRFDKVCFSNESNDKKIYRHLTFSFCTFDHLGFLEAKFEHCVFKHCDFMHCYLVKAKFINCDFTGSYFGDCNFSWAEFENSTIGYTRFYRCAPVFAQIAQLRIPNPKSASKLYRNLASEHCQLGNWGEVAKFVHQSYVEDQRYYNYIVFGENDYYRSKYTFFQRAKYAWRYLLGYISGVVWGYGVSWGAFFRSILLVWLVALPLINYLIGKSPLENTGEGLARFFNAMPLLYRETTLAFFPLLPSTLIPFSNKLELPFHVICLESLMGTIFLGLFVSMLFRAGSKGAG